MPIINVTDLRPEGSDKTYRQLNMEKTWKYPLNSLVKVLKYVYESDTFVDDPHGLVLHVTKHGRDCDGTPLYYLSHLTAEKYKEALDVFKGGYDGQTFDAEVLGSPLAGGYSEESLRLIALPHEIEKDE